MKLRHALALATAAHLVLGIVLWRTWPAQVPEGEVVPLELHPVDPPPPPPPAAAAEPAIAPQAAHKGGKSAGRPAAKIELAVEPQGEVPSAAPIVEAAVATANATGGATGGGAGSGGGKPGGVGSLPTGIVKPVDHRALLGEAMERIRQHRRYPELARRRRLEGTVVVGFRVGETGAVENARIKKSVDEMLDQAALDAVRDAAPLPAPLASDGELEVDLHFSLQP